MRNTTKYATILVIILTTLALLNCKKLNKNNNNVSKPIVSEKEVINEYILNFEVPRIDSITNLKDIKNSYQNAINIVDKSLSKLKKKEAKITLYENPNIPVTIWYSDNKPIKIEQGVTNDTGKLEGVINYYLKDGKIWFSDQIFAKYIFQDNKLKYWMDKKWNVNEIPTQNFIDREKELINDVKLMISQFK